jgi:serine/threonine protein kinase
VEGLSLSDELQPNQPLSESKVLEILQGIVEVLAFIHQHHIIHRDIKPSNVIRRGRDRKLVLIDFGAVKQIQPQGSASEDDRTVVIGTAGYAPAEQLAGQPVLSSDLFSAGIIAIQALTGLLPKELPRDAQTGELLWQAKAQVSVPLAMILNKMVRYHFNDRYASAAEALQEIERLTG